MTFPITNHYLIISGVNLREEHYPIWTTDLYNIMLSFKTLRKVFLRWNFLILLVHVFMLWKHVFGCSLERPHPNSNSNGIHDLYLQEKKGKNFPCRICVFSVVFISWICSSDAEGVKTRPEGRNKIQKHDLDVIFKVF